MVQSTKQLQLIEEVRSDRTYHPGLQLLSIKQLQLVEGEDS